MSGLFWPHVAPTRNLRWPRPGAPASRPARWDVAPLQTHAWTICDTPSSRPGGRRSRAWPGFFAVLLACFLSTLPAAEPEDHLDPRALSAITRGQTYLAGQQRPDGSFGGTGLTGAAAIAFLATGNPPGRGPQGAACARAVESLLAKAQPSGLIHDPADRYPPMYNHGLATLALAEVLGESADPRVREILRKAVELIVTTQNQKGGWRYQPRVEGDDISVTVMQLMALRAAQDAGVPVPRECIDLGIAYVKSCHNAKSAGKDGGFAYIPGGESGPGRTGAGVTSLQVAGNYRAAEVKDGVAYLLECQPLGSREVREHPWYAWYYITMGIYQAQSAGAWGREAWHRWYPAMVDHICREQKDDGHWSDGVYPTTMALIMLAVPYRCLPVYQR